MKLRSLLLVASTLACLTSTAPPALAQSAPGPASTADIVRLKDGSIYRGTIIELVPGDHVRIVLPTGDEHRFAAGDLAYAGAATTEKPTAAAAPKSDSTVVLHFTASEPEMHLLRATGLSETSGSGYGIDVGRVMFTAESRQYALLCTAPCDARIAAGSSDLALWARGRVFTLGAVDVEDGTNLHATYASRRGIRTVGWVTLIASILTGGVVMVSADQSSSCPASGPCSGGLDTGRFLAGVAVAGVGTLVGALLAMTKDHADFSIEPQATAQVDRRPLEL